MENYHFALKGNLFDLTFKNYHKFVFTLILWLHNLFRNLMNILKSINRILPKVIKLWKFVTGVTNLKTRIRKYHSKARDGSYAMAPVHTLYGCRWWWWWWLKARDLIRRKKWACGFAFSVMAGLVAGRTEVVRGWGQQVSCMQEVSKDLQRLHVPRNIDMHGRLF